MKSQRLKIPVEQYLQMQHPFGYKVEYYNGEAVFQPQELSIDGHLTLKPQKVQPRYHYQAVETKHQPAMKTAFFDAFHDEIEFCDWPEPAIHKRAAECIDGYLAGTYGQPNPASKLLLDQNGAVTALALFITKKSGKTQLDLLFVLPKSQRQGVATEMVALACNELLQQGVSEIYSDWHALNEASQNWHHRFGFSDVYSQFYIQRKYNWFKREIHRLQSQDINEGIQELHQQKDHWYSLLDEEWQRFTRP